MLGIIKIQKGRGRHFGLKKGGRCTRKLASSKFKTLEGNLCICICMYMYTQYSDSVNFQVMTITQRDQH